MIKKLTTLLMAFVAVSVVVACSTVKYEITFNSNGGSAVAPIQVEEGKVAKAPNDPTREDYLFSGWYTSPELTGDAYGFSTEVTESFTLHAKWTLDAANAEYIRFVDHRQNTTTLVEAVAGKVPAPTNPTRAGYRFGGWYTTKAGLTWNEKAPVEFPAVAPEGGRTLYAYWEPLNSKQQDWTDGETYFTTLSSTTTYVFNPMNYQWTDELAFIQNLSTAAYYNEVNWYDAIEKGIAAYPGDFSKIGSGEGKFSIDLLDNHYQKGAMASYPKNQDGFDLEDENGSLSIEASSTLMDTVWTIDIRTDMKYEDGTPITAHDYVYTYLAYIDPLLLNSRGSTFFPTADRKNGYKIVNSRQYFLQEPNLDGVKGTVAKESVGFKALDNDTIQITFDEPVSQTSPIGLLSNMYLINKTAFEKSLNESKDKSSYGTILHPYVSYGPYIIKSWDNNAKIILNKNYDYVLRRDVNYKSISYQFTSGPDQNAELFEAGKLSALGLSGEYAQEYAEWPNNLATYGYAVGNLDINVSDSLDGKRQANPIMKDLNFRNALLFGFDRQEFNNTVFAPNTASLAVWPIQGKQYNSDEFWYSNTPEHSQVLQELGINDETAGYDAIKAKQYFDRAYAAWVAAGHGKQGDVIQIEYIGRDSDTFKRYAVYIKNHFEKLFDGKVSINVTDLATTTLFPRVENRDFDMTFDFAGWSFADAAFAYMPLKGIFYTTVFGESAGGNDYNDFEGLATAQIRKPIDMKATLAYLETTKYTVAEGETLPSGMWDSTTSSGATLALYELLKANDGMFTGTVVELFNVVLEDSFLFWKDEPLYPGVVDELTRITAEFEYAILKYVTMIPVSSNTTKTAYAMNVVITWPEYSYELIWGSTRYRYLNTDIDFQK